jgi:leucine dehydrogenase
MRQRGHEGVFFVADLASGLRGIIAIHSSLRGPALGGIRVRHYPSEADALDDVLRLSEGMTYKNALAGLSLGGGKSVILVEPNSDERREALFTAFAKRIHALHGSYIGAEDMGTSPKDISCMRKITPFVAGHPHTEGGSGDPSPWTARGVFLAMKTASENLWGSSDLSGKRILIEGVGSVGSHLVALLREGGAHCIVSDINEELVQDIASRYGCERVSPSKLYDVPADIYAPCAIGQTVSEETVKRLSCSIIAGAANNQISSSGVYDYLARKEILYCPDFAINSGGVISIAGEFEPEGWNSRWVQEKLEEIPSTLVEILNESRKRGDPTEKTALHIARGRVRKGEA